MSNGNSQRIRYRSLPALVGGAVVILFGVVLLGDSIIRGSGRSASLSALGLLAGIGLVYLVSVRPAVIAKDDVLLIRNPLQDVEVPWSSIEELRIRYQLDVEAGDGQVAHAWAVPGSRSSRQRDLRRQLRVYDADLKMGLSTKEDPLPRRGTGYAERVLEE
ncbi:MAG: PH domain-containing protein, partial [Sporichthyaceae bacterium]|nr:PH domain-containing protein [Sporichthyaceae bacterium]